MPAWKLYRDFLPDFLVSLALPQFDSVTITDPGHKQGDNGRIARKHCFTPCFVGFDPANAFDENRKIAIEHPERA